MPCLPQNTSNSEIFQVLRIKALPETLFPPDALSPHLQMWKWKYVTFAKISRLSGQQTGATKAVALSHGRLPKHNQSLLITNPGGIMCCEVIHHTRALNTEAPCILKIMLSHRSHVFATNMKWVCFIFLWNLTTNTLMMIYSSSSSPPSSSAFSAIIAVDWKTPRACKWKKYQRGQATC